MNRENDHFSETLEDLEQAGFARFKAQQRVSARAKAIDQLDFEEAYSEIKASRARTPFCFITVNPKPGTTVEQLQTICEDAFATYLCWYAYSFELRKKDEGLHCHCLGQIYESRQNSNFSRIKNYFLGVCGNLKHIDIKYVDSSELEKVYSYLTKVTQAKSKRSAYRATLKWREDNGIEPVYITGDLPTCLVPDISEDPSEMD